MVTFTSRHSAVLDGSRSPFGIDVVEQPQPEPPRGGMIARVTMAGVCGTDAHRLSGDVPPGPVPYAFGHEPVGVVATLGADRDRDAAGRPLRVGDRIVWFPASAFCGECDPCLSGYVRGCQREPWPYPATDSNPAGYQDVATLSANVEAYRLPDGVPDETFVALGCALPTAITGMDRLGAIASEHTVVVQGSGPVGLASTTLAALEEPAQIILIGTPAERLEWGSRLGAAHLIDLSTTTAEERRDEVLRLTGGRGAEVVIEAAGVPEAFAEGLDLLARGGRYLVSGLYSGERKVAINPVIINNRVLTIIGNLGATKVHRGRAVELAAELERRFAISTLVTHRFSLSQVTEAIESLGSAEATKSVVVP